jgi:predicted metal-binding protein
MTRRHATTTAFGAFLCTFCIAIHVTAFAFSNNVAVRVCQNKHCCKRAAKDIDVLQTLNNLLVQNGEGERAAVSVESVSCLSNCDMGPNVEITLPNGTAVLLHDMRDAQQSAVRLYELANAPGSHDSTPIFSPPKILLAASKVMETSQQLQSMDERIRYLSSVVTKLESSDCKMTAANAHAHALRAQAHHEWSASRNDRDESWHQTVADAQYVTRDLASVATAFSMQIAFRAWVDAETLHASRTKRSNYSKAVAVLQEWYKAQPGLRTKLQQEIQDLQCKR